MPNARNTSPTFGSTHAAGHRTPPWRVLAPALVVCAGVCWGIISLFSQALAQAGLNSVQITFVRCALTTLGLGLYLAIFRREAFRFRLRDIWIFVGSGVASIAFFNVCYFTSIAECGVSIAAILLYTGPCFVVALSALLFRERLTRRKLTALGVAFLGCLLVVGMDLGSARLSAFGVLAGLGAGFGYALYSIFGRVALARYSPITHMFYTFLFAAAVLAPFAAVGDVVACAAASPQVVGAMVLLALLSTIVPFACYTTGLAHMETSKASIMTFIEPMVAMFVGVFVFGEVLSAFNLAGVACILGAVVLLNVNAGESERG